LIESAVLDPKSLPSAAQYLPGYDGQIHLLPLLWLIAKLMVALYLLASALAGHDRKSLTAIEIVLRLIVALLIMFKPAAIHLPALLAAAALLSSHYLRNRQVASA
ncbi:MAG: C4-dicarboxylate ABC transporter, partial [Pseudomonadota bacterium]